MSNSSNIDTPEVGEVNLASTLAELQRGEKTAEAIEANLASLEAKIDALLASAEETERTMKGLEAEGEKENEVGGAEVNGQVEEKEITGSEEKA